MSKKGEVKIGEWEDVVNGPDGYLDSATCTVTEYDENGNVIKTWRGVIERRPK